MSEEEGEAEASPSCPRQPQTMRQTQTKWTCTTGQQTLSGQIPTQTQWVCTRASILQTTRQ